MAAAAMPFSWQQDAAFAAGQGGAGASSQAEGSGRANSNSSLKYQVWRGREGLGTA